jgi:NAD(P)-dependent dehydrogenase (short-subunit alcohol dehydrogenase family)
MASDLTAASIFSVKGRVALVTGAGSGIGLMAARTLAANGAKVYIVGRRKALLDKVVKENTGLSGTLVAVEGDVGTKESLQNVANAVQEGFLDILVNNAGIEGPVTKLGLGVETMSGSEISKAILSNESFESWDNLFRINTHSVFFATMTLLPLLEAAARKGRDVSVTNTTSISATIKWSQDHYAYNASKAAANHLTLMLAHELNYRSTLKIRVNAIAPGMVNTEMTEAMLADAEKNANAPQPKGTGNPAGRAGTDAEIGGAFLFMATNAFTTGQILAVDGGYITAVPGTM